jgi:LuxR family maltose regulon positive regulatory protein
MDPVDRPQPVNANPLRPRILPPALAPTILDRGRLRERLDLPRAGAVTFVVAPSGYGKSALVAGWLQGRVGAWLSLDRTDDSAADVTRAIVAACQRVTPGIGRVALAMLGSAPSPSALGAAIAGELAAAGGPFVLVLDDAHELVSEDAWAVVQGLVAQAGPDLHVALTSWQPPRLDRDALLAAGRLVEIGALDLVFHPAEISAIAERAGETLRPERLERILALSAGWPVIVRLLLTGDLADRRLDTMFGDPSAADTVAEYVRRLTAIRSPQAVEALEWATLVDPLSDDLLTAMLGPERCEGGDLLATLGDVVVMPIAGGDAGWYRLQPIVREELHRRLLARVGEPEMRAARLRAADWYAAHGLTTEAIRQAVDAGDLQRATTYVVIAGFDRLRFHATGEVGLWLSLLPAPVFEGRPDLLLLRSIDFSRGLAVIASHATAKDARRVLETENGRAASLIPAERLLPLISVFELDVSEGPTDAESLLTLYRRLLVECAPVDQMARGVLATSVAIRLTSMQGVEAAQALLEERSGGIGVADAVETAYNFGGLALLRDFKVASGRDLRATLDECRRRSAANGIHGLQAFAATRQGWEALRQLDLPTATALFAESAALPEISGFLAWREERQGMAMVLQLRGEEDAANAVAEHVVTTIERGALLGLLENARSFQARLWLAQRDFVKVDQWLQTTPLDPTFEPPAFPEITLQTWVTAMLSFREALADGSRLDGDIERAIMMLADVSDFLQHDRGKLGTVLCRALFARERGMPAGDYLTEAVQRAALRDDLLSFAEHGEPMAEFLAEHRAILPEPAFVDRAMAAAERVGQIYPHRLMSRRLTDRELEVLVRLPDRLNRREIAGEMFISDRTVQRHTVNLYRKLGVSNRADAVHRGIELGWLPQP